MPAQKLPIIPAQTPFVRIDFGVSIYFIENQLSYPLRHFVPPPLTIRGGMEGAFDTYPYYKGRRGSASVPPPCLLHGSFVLK